MLLLQPPQWNGEWREEDQEEVIVFIIESVIINEHVFDESLF